jgi:hypothetical protein
MTALTIANTDIKIHKAGATTLANKNSGGATHISAGNYYAVLDATDTDTAGSGAIVVQVSGALAVRHQFSVLPTAIYDWLFGVTANLPVNVTQFGGTNLTASGGRPEVNTTHAAGTAWNSGAIGASTLASDTITAAKIATDAGAEIADAIHDEVVEGSTTLRQMLRLEMLGMSKSRGPTAYSTLKTMGYKGSREKVFEQLSEWRNNLMGETA